MGIIDSLMNRLGGDQPAPQPQAFVIPGLDGKQITVTEDDLAKMDHATLLRIRDANQGNKQLQELLAPYEHRAFAREATTENLGLAAPIAVATPLYAGAKAVGLMRDENTTNSSFKQVGQGLLGVGEGLVNRARAALK